MVLTLVFFASSLFYYAAPNTAQAAVGINHQINFQGKLVNSDGTNVTDGSYSILFTVYQGGIASGGNICVGGSSLWTETQSVTAANGIFQLNLGSVTALPGSLDFNSDTTCLAIKVGADAEMTPRILFTAVPQAFNSEKLGGLDKTGFIQNNTVQQAASNFNISGAGVIGTTLTTPTLQSAAATALTITGNAASTWSTSAGNITLQAGSGTVSLGSTTTLSSTGALTVSGGTTLALTSTGANAISLDSGTTGAVNIGTNANAKTVTIGNITGTTGVVVDCGTNGCSFGASATAHTTTVGSSTLASSVLIQAGTGNLTLTTLGTGTLGVGNNAVAQTIAVGNVTGATALSERVGTGNYTLDGVAGSTYTIGASTTSGTITVGGTAQTGTQTFGQSTASNTIAIGASAGAAATQAINIGTSATATSTTNVLIGSTIAGSTTLQNNATININAPTVAGNATTQNLFNTTATAVNFAGAATTLSVGAATGTTTINGNLTVAAAKTLTVTNLSTAGIVTNTAAGVIGTVATIPVANGGTGVGTTPTNGQLLFGNGTNYTVGTLGVTGLTATPGVGTLALAVNYGSGANQAAQGNTNIVCPSAAGNASLSGAGNTIAVGAGGTCTALTLSSTPSFTSLTVSGGGPSIIASGAPSASATASLYQGGSAIVGGSANGTLYGGNIATTADLLNLQVSGAFKIKVDNAGNQTLAGSLTSVGVNAGSGLIQGSGGLNISGGTVTLPAASIANAALQTSVTTQGNTFNGASQLVQLNASSQYPALSGTLITNLNASALASGTVPSAVVSGAYGNITAVGTLTSLTTSGVITSTLATGTAPLTIASTTQVANLNSSFLGGYAENQIAENLRSNNNISGGGTVSWNGTYNWSARYIVIANGNGADFSTAGYFDISVPVNGTTITGVGGHANITTASGFPLLNWDALYYVLPIGSTSTSLPANFRVATYTGAFQAPSNWVLLGILNGDNGVLKTTAGISFRSGQTATAGSLDNPTFNTSLSTPALTVTGSITLPAASVANSALQSSVTLQGNSFNGASQLVQLNASSQLPAVSGALLTNLNASALASGTVGATVGGTGQSSYAVGDLLYAGTTTTVSKLADVAAGQCLVSGGVGVAPAYGACGTSNIVAVPTSSAQNTITPATSGVVGLTINGTNVATAATALIVNQGFSADGQALNVTGGSQTNGLVVTRTNVGTTTNLLNLTNTSGTVTNGILLSGTYTNLINAGAALTVTSAGVATVSTGYQIGGLAATGNFLRGNGTNFVSSAIQSTDLPAGSGNYINNTTTPQTANFNITGSAAVGSLAVAGTSTLNGNTSISGTNTLTVGTGATSLGGTLGVSGAAILTSTLTVNGTQLTNNGSTLNTALALANFATGGSIGTAATTVDIDTSITVNQTTAGQTLTLPNPTSATAGRLVYISNIGTTSFTLLGSPLKNGATATIFWNGTAWTFAGADGASILNQSASTQTANFNIQSAAATTIGAVIQGATSQAVDLLQLQNSSALSLAKFDANGGLTIAANTNVVVPLATNGTAATSGLSVTGQKGGNTTGTTAQTAGAGAGLTFLGGAGGDAATGSTNGAGGNITLNGGAAGSGAGTAGSSGYVLLQTSGGNVGIGTAAPANALEVKSSAADVARFSSATTTSSIVLGPNNVFSSPRVSGIQNAGATANDLVFTTNGTEAARVFSDGNVSIGSATENAQLYVNNKQSLSNAVTIQGAAGQATGTSIFQVLNSTSAKLLQVDNIGQIILGYGGYTQSVTSNGVQALGNTLQNPGFERLCSGWTSACTNANVVLDAANAHSGNYVYRYTQASATDSTGFSGSQYFEVSAGQTVYAEMWVKSSLSTDGQGGFYIDWRNKDNVNIGNSNSDWTNSQTYSLKTLNAVAPAGAVYGVFNTTIRGNGTTAGVWYLDDAYVHLSSERSQTTFQNSVNTTTAFQIQNASNVSVLNVDTTNSSVTLRGNTASDAATVGAELVTSQDFTNATFWTGCNGGVGGWTGTTTTSAHNTGNTIACTATATNYTVVSGATYQVQFQLAGNTSGSDTVAASLGGVSTPAIGQTGTNTQTAVITTTGTGALTFTPTTNFNGTISAVSVKLITLANSTLTVQSSTGSAALEVRVSSANLNTFLGLTSGQSNTTGYSNTATGTSSLQSNTTGFYNTATGRSSLQNNTTGYGNTASGLNSLQNNTTGSNNTATGTSSLQSNTTGFYNTATGTSSLQSNTTGFYNTATGRSSLQNNTTGYSISAIGFQSLLSNTTGFYNTATGRSSLQNNTTGYENTTIGASSLLNNTTGFQNTAVGNNSLTNNITGNLNTALGYYAGFQDQTNTTFTTGAALQNATSIGAYAQVQASNSIVLGSVDLLTKVGIGTTIPSNTLSVSPIQYSTGTAGTANVSSTTITGVGTTWTSFMVNSEIVFANGQKANITAFTSTTSITVGSAVTVPSGTAYRIHYVGLQVNSSGSTGIGTSVPDATLSVRAQAQNAVVNIYGVASTVDYGVIQVSSQGNLTNASSRALVLQPNGGNVGIGTANPLSLLTVFGTPTSVATSSLLQLGAAIAGGNTAVNGGTYLGLNAPATGAGSTADFLNLQLNGAVKYKLDNAGNTTQAGTMTVQGAGASSITGTLNVGGATTVEKFAVGGAMALQETTAPTGTIGYGKLYVNSTDKQLHFVNSSGADLAIGTHTKKIVLTAEYAGAVLDAANDVACASANAGSMTSGFAGTATLHSFYKWTTASATAQCYDVVVRVPIPSDYASFAAAPTVTAYSSDGVAAINVETRDTSGTLDVNNYAALVPGAATWTTSSLTGLTSANYTAGGTMTMRIRLTSTNNNFAQVGNIVLTYNTNY